ncbi:N-acetyltransferase B complex non catalytic subunit-domain-containing protein [Dipodascopsis uninucleata]
MSNYRANVIWDAIDSRSYKQAMLHVTKALKRNPKDEYVLALKAYILFMQKKMNESLLLTKELVAQNPVDPRTLELLYGILLDAEGLEEAGKVYEGAARKRPRDEELNLNWFWAMCTGGDVRGQQKAAMALQKSFSRRHYILYSIMSGFLLASSPDIVQQEKTLFSTLTYRLMPLIEPIQTAEEAVLKAHVLALLPDKQDELIAFLTAESAEKWNNLELATLRLDKVVASENWDLVFEVAMRTLTKELRDDFDSWKVLALAVKKIGSSEKLQEFEKLLKEKAKTRNGALAAVHYATVKTDKESELLEASKLYFQNFGRKQCAFEDLRWYLTSISAKTEWLEFIDSFIQENEIEGRLNISSSDQINVLVNARKFHYLLAPEDKTFVDENLKLYIELLPTFKSKVVTDYHYGTDLLLMSACWILEGRSTSFAMDGSIDKVLFAIVLLEIAASRDKHQFYVRLWLVRLYMYLGCFQSALGHFMALSIKNVQYDTLAHYLFSRISTIHPNYSALLKTREIYDTNAVQTPQMIKSAYQRAAYSQIAGFMEFSRRLSDSIGKGTLVIEAKRIARLLGMKMEGLAINPRLSKTTWQDNRDYDVLYNIGDNSDIEKKYSIGIRQDASWVKAFIVKEAIIDSILEMDTEKLEIWKQDLSELLKSSTSLTPGEKLSMSIAISLTDIALRHSVDDYKKLENLIKEFISVVAKWESSDSLNWEWLHSRFLLFETFKIIQTALDSLSSASVGVKKRTTTSVAAIKQTISASVDQIKEDARRLKLSRDSWASEKITFLETWSSIEELCASMNSLENIIQGIAKSQNEALTLLRNIRL